MNHKDFKHHDVSFFADSVKLFAPDDTKGRNILGIGPCSTGWHLAPICLHIPHEKIAVYAEAAAAFNAVMDRHEQAAQAPVLEVEAA